MLIQFMIECMSQCPESNVPTYDYYNHHGEMCYYIVKQQP